MNRNYLTILERTSFFKSGNDREENKWVSQWHGMTMLRESFSEEALHQHLNIFNLSPYNALALEAFALLAMMDFYKNIKEFVFCELGSGRAPWCLTTGAAIANKLIPYPPEKCFVIAVEPEPTHYLWSKLHVEHNMINGIIIQSAIGSIEGTARFMANTDPAAHMGQHISNDGNITVNLTTIDSLIKQHKLDKIHAVHMDVQGQEIEAIRGAQQALSSDIIDHFIIGTHGQHREKLLTDILSATHRLIVELPAGRQVELPGFSKPFQSQKDGVQVWQRKKL